MRLLKVVQRCNETVTSCGYSSYRVVILTINILFTNYFSSFPFPFVPLQRRECLVAPLFLWIVLVPCAGDQSSDRGREWRGECDRQSKRDRLRLTADLTTRDLWRSRRWAKGEWEKLCLFIPVGLQEYFTCRKILRHWTFPLYFPSERKMCCRFLSPLKSIALAGFWAHNLWVQWPAY
jgi:hypothetical protein